MCETGHCKILQSSCAHKILFNVSRNSQNNGTNILQISPITRKASKIWPEKNQSYIFNKTRISLMIALPILFTEIRLALRRPFSEDFRSHKSQVPDENWYFQTVSVNDVL